MEIISGKEKKPYSVLLHGEAGLGKTTWASNSIKPLFIGADESGEIDVRRLKRAESWGEFLKQVQWIVDTRPQFQTLVIDTLDSVEKLLHRQIVDQDPKASGSMATAFGGYGKAFERAESEMMTLRSQLQILRDRDGKGIILLAHSNKTLATNTVLGLQFDTYETNLQKKAQALFVDWVSCVLFLTTVVAKVDDDNTDKVFAIGQGERVLMTEKRPGFLAKNRYNLPAKMPCDFGAFFEKYNEFFEVESTQSPDEVYQQCIGLMHNISDDNLKIKILIAMDKAMPDIRKISTVRKQIEQRINA